MSTKELRAEFDELIAMAENLLPCPFCGEEPLTQEIAAHSHTGGIAGFMQDYPGSFTIECLSLSCNCGMIADTREQVVAAWNRRPAIAQKEAAAPGDLHAAIMALPRFTPIVDSLLYNPFVETPQSPDGEFVRFDDIETLLADLAQPVAVDAPTCKWTLDDWESGTWASSCGELWSFIDGGPKENRVRFCHHCGCKVAIDAQDGEDKT